MYEFKSHGKWHLKGRGDVYGVINPFTHERDECPFTNACVKIDGKVFLCIGVESFATPTTQKGWNLGLLVDREYIDE